MGHAAELSEFFEIMEVLEIPVTRHYKKVAVYKPEVMPQTLDQILDLMESGIKPKIESREIAHSVTRNHYNLLMSSLGGVNASSTSAFGDGEITLKDVGGTIRGVTTRGLEVHDNAFIYNITFSDDSNQGIWVGTGSTAEDFDDFELDTKIDHGNAAGELRYWDMLEPKQEWDVPTRQWTITNRRYFTNHSGGSISVAEMCMVGRAAIYASYYYVVVARDVLGAAVAVGDEELLMAEYQILSDVWPS